MKTILSFDVDRTLVDRTRHSHAVSPRIKDSILSANSMPDIKVVLNTGRDLTALQEFDAEIEAVLDALFLSGRCKRIGSEVEIDARALVPMRVIESLFDFAGQIEIPFLDIKTGKGAVHIPFTSSPLPFGFQKPKGWYNRFSPSVLSGSRERTLSSIEEDGPIRIEVPVRTANINALREILGLPDVFFTEVVPIHHDYIEQNLSADLRDWNAFQILSPFDGNNKGNSLKEYSLRLDSVDKIVHFGDSDDSHNSDSIVTEHIPEAEFIRIDWSRQSQGEIEALIANQVNEQRS